MQNAIDYRTRWSGSTEGDRYGNGNSYFGIKLDVGAGSGGSLFVYPLLKIPVTVIPERKFNSFFERLGYRDKHAVADLIAERFTKISRRLLAKPRFYEPEPRALLENCFKE